MPTTPAPDPVPDTDPVVLTLWGIWYTRLVEVRYGNEAP